MSGCGADEQVELTNGIPLALGGKTNVTIVIERVRDGIYFYVVLQNKQKPFPS